MGLFTDRRYFRQSIQNLLARKSGAIAPQVGLFFTLNPSIPFRLKGTGWRRHFIGDEGNDILIGGGGDDILNGTNESNGGYGEKDILIGQGGADLFVLGDAFGPLYIFNGNSDRALIKDFNPLEDRVQLYGSARDYTTTVANGKTRLIEAASGDRIAIFHNTSGLDLNRSAFEYI